MKALAHRNRPHSEIPRNAERLTADTFLPANIQVFAVPDVRAGPETGRAERAGRVSDCDGRPWTAGRAFRKPPLYPLSYGAEGAMLAPPRAGFTPDEPGAP